MDLIYKTKTKKKKKENSSRPIRSCHVYTSFFFFLGSANAREDTRTIGPARAFYWDLRSTRARVRWKAAIARITSEPVL